MGDRLPRPWCCPEPRCTPVHNLGERAAWIHRPLPGSSFLCFGVMETPIEFVYDGTPHANDLRSCTYTPLKGVIAHQENADDWRAIADAYRKALDALGGWNAPSVQQPDACSDGATPHPDLNPHAPPRPNPSVPSGGPGGSWPTWLFLGAFFAAFAPIGLAIGLLVGTWEPLLGDLIAAAVFVPFLAWLEHVG